MYVLKQLKIIIILCLIFVFTFSNHVISKDIHVLKVTEEDSINRLKLINNKTLYKYPAWTGIVPEIGTIVLNCTASYPVQWTFNGYYIPSSMAKFQSPKRLKNDNKIYSIVIKHHFWDRKLDYAITVRITCEKVGNPDVEKSVLLFVREKQSSQYLIGASKQSVLNSALIPCPTVDPTVLPSLHVETNEGGRKEVTDPLVQYNFYEGFRLNSSFNGLYTCRSRKSTVNINASASQAVEYFEVIPKTSFVRVFFEDIILFACKSTLGKQTKLILDDADGNLTVEYSRSGDRAKVKVTKPTSSYTDETQFKGVGKCTIEEDGQTVLVKEWSFEFLNAPISMDSKLESFSCSANTCPLLLQVFKCHNKMECTFFSKFTGTANQSDIEVRWVSGSYMGENGKPICSETVYTTYPSGLGQCIVDGMVKEWEFFTSLNNRKYTSWKNAPKKELIQMTKDATPNEITNFFCKAVSFLFADSIYFEIEFVNGSRNLLEQNNVTVNISDSSDRERFKMKWLYYVGILDIILPENSAAVHCVAPWWNTTEEMRTSIYFDLAKSVDSTEVAIYTIISTVSISAVCVLLVLLLIFIKRHKTAQQLLRSLTDEEVKQFLKGRPELLGKEKVNNIETVDLLPFPQEYEIPFTDLQFDSGKNFLGFGNFSYVVRGVIISKGAEVAIKISKPSANIDFFKSLLSEVKIMVYIGKHENVLSLAGVCTENIKSRSIHIATEVCELGNLKKYMIKARPSFVNIINANQEIGVSILTENPLTLQQLTILDLIRFSCEIAKGMEYLSYKSVIHADLAARNVLLTSKKVVKVSDFGLSKQLYENRNYVKKSSTPLPWRWMAIESLTTMTFSTSSDVWAYGITLFEIFSLGDTPYPNEEWNAGFVSRLKDGMRMGKPNHSTKEIYLLMSECWEKQPELRPSFSTIRSFFEKLSGKYFVQSTSCHEGERVSLEHHASELTAISSAPNSSQSCQLKNEVDIDTEEATPQPQYLELQVYSAIEPENIDKI